MITLAIIKPDAVGAGKAGKILAQLESAGFKIRAARLVKLTTAQAEAFYAVHRERPFYRSLVAFMTSGPALAVALQRDDAVARQADGAGRFYWKGALRAQVGGECRRCLAPVPLTVTADIRALVTEDPDAQEDPDSYPLAHDATQVDPRPAVREELLLAVPPWVVCREGCRGLCPRCGRDLNAGPCGCPPARDPRWQVLAALKGKPRD